MARLDSSLFFWTFLTVGVPIVIKYKRAWRDSGKPATSKKVGSAHGK
jgi:hypothetical protein